MASVSQRWTKRESEPAGWQELHQMILEYRHERDCSIHQFLSECGLSPHGSYFQQLSSVKGKDMQVTGSAGYTFNQAVRKFFDELRSPSFMPNVRSKLDKAAAQVCDLNMDHGDELQALNVLHLTYSEADQCMHVGLAIEADKDEVLCYLQQAIDLVACTVQFRRMEVL